MKNKLIILIFIIFFTGVLTSCKKNAPIIIFNSKPITAETILNNSREFKLGQRIYYIFITEKPIKDEVIRVQLSKKDEKTSIMGYKIVNSNDYRVYQDQVYYYTDYIVPSDRGLYLMQIFSLKNLNEPLARDYFIVKP